MRKLNALMLALVALCLVVGSTSVNAKTKTANLSEFVSERTITLPTSDPSINLIIKSGFAGYTVELSGVPGNPFSVLILEGELNITSNYVTISGLQILLPSTDDDDGRIITVADYSVFW